MQKILRLSVVLMMVILISFGTSVNATVNTGQGTQRVVDPLMSNAENLVKGAFATFGEGMIFVESGTWITTGFGVIDDVYTPSCEDSFQQHIDFLLMFEINFYWDGELIQNLYDPYNPDGFIIIDELEDGSCVLLTLYRYYISPPSVGDHLLHTEFFIFGDLWFTTNKFVTILPH